MWDNLFFIPAFNGSQFFIHQHLQVQLLFLLTTPVFIIYYVNTTLSIHAGAKIYPGPKPRLRDTSSVDHP
jgi:hypothetical protein